MEVAISSTVLDAIMRDVRQNPLQEVCGLLFGGARVISGRQACANVAANVSTTFELDPRALVDAHKAERNGGRRVVGHYHSHPNGRPEPSALDAAAALPDGSLWLILTQGKACLWQAVAHGKHLRRFDEVQLIVEQPRLRDTVTSAKALAVFGDCKS